LADENEIDERRVGARENPLRRFPVKTGQIHPRIHQEGTTDSVRAGNGSCITVATFFNCKFVTLRCSSSNEIIFIVASHRHIETDL